jgi:ParB family chromosome partitioning protein
MAGLMRELLTTLSYDQPVRLPTETASREHLAHLDTRLAGVVRDDRAGRELIMLQPSECAVWDGNPRDVPRLSSEGCRSLIESIAAEGGNRIPVLVRLAGPDAETPYELLAGSRRRFAIDWLNHNGRPELRLSAMVIKATDEEAFRIADIENRERADISEIDRARSYQAAVDRFYHGVQSRMAQALSLSNSQLSRLLALAQLPDEVVEAFATRDDLRVRHSEVLTPLLRRHDSRALVIEAAIAVGEEQQRRSARNQPLLPAAAVLARLRQAVVEQAHRQEPLPILIGGVQVGRIRHGKAGDIAVDLAISPEADVEAILADLSRRIAELRKDMIILGEEQDG